MRILMRMLRLLWKVVLLPLLLSIILVQWVGIFLNGISSVVFGILSFLLWSVTLISLALGQASGGEAVRMLILAFVIFLLPYVGSWIIERITVLRCILADFMRS